MTRYYRVFNSEQVEGDCARNAEQAFKDKLKHHDPNSTLSVTVVVAAGTAPSVPAAADHH